MKIRKNSKMIQTLLHRMKSLYALQAINPDAEKHAQALADAYWKVSLDLGVSFEELEKARLAAIVRGQGYGDVAQSHVQTDNVI